MNEKPVSVVIPADLSHTGGVRRATKPVDACLAEIVRRLNHPIFGDVPFTRGACCGHGKGQGSILLEDGRELRVQCNCSKWPDLGASALPEEDE